MKIKSIIFSLIMATALITGIAISQEKVTRKTLLDYIDKEMNVLWDDMEEFYTVTQDDVTPFNYSQIYLSFNVNGVSNEDPEDESFENAKMGEMRVVFAWSAWLSKRDEALFMSGKGIESVEAMNNYPFITEVMIKIKDKMNKIQLDPNNKKASRFIIYAIKAGGLIKGHRHVEFNRIVVDDELLALLREFAGSSEGDVKIKFKGDNFSSESFEPDDDDIAEVAKTIKCYDMFVKYLKKDDPSM